MLSSAPPRPASSDLSFFSASRSSKPVASTVSTVVVTTRITRRPAPATPIASSSSPASSSTLSTTPSKKRKTSSDAASESPCAVNRDVKRLRATPVAGKTRKRVTSASKSSSRVSSRQNTQAPSPEPIYRSSRSRSTSLFPNFEQVAVAAPCVSRIWVTDEDGSPGSKVASSEAVVKRLMRTYKAYFTNPDDRSDKSFEPHPSDYPVVELEYPNTNASERFILLAPKDKDHYNPILCLEKNIYTMVECYLTPEQQSLFGTIPRDSLVDAPSPPPSPSPSPSPPNSQASCSSSRSDASLSSLTSLSSAGSRHHTPPSPLRPQVNYLRSLQRAIHLRDGPLFVQTVSVINSLLRMLKYPKLPTDPFSPTPRNTFINAVHSWTNAPLPSKLLFRIIEENYQRSVGPHVASLKNYEAFSSTVYGELMPSFVHDMIKQVGLKEDSLFLDLGSGVGNVVVQASFQTGCRSYGIELMPAPASVARKQVEQFKIRCRMWGLKLGDIELEEGDMLKSQRVTELLPKADVVLVDNKVFEESLNVALRPKFLDLKEGAILISLNPFVPSLNARMTERNVDDISAIFDVSEHQYKSGSVSWGPSGGSYYIHRVDREGYAKIREKFENLRAGRSSRSRR